MLRKKVLYAALCALVAVACHNGGSNTGQKGETRTFPAVIIPSIITDEVDAAEYTLRHFWDTFADTSKVYLSDSLYSNGVSMEEMDEKFLEFANLALILQDNDIACVKEAMLNMYGNMVKCQQADSTSNVFSTLQSLSEKYFYDPNSPFRNEDIYLPIVQQLATSPYIDNAMRSAYEFDAKMCALNKKGTLAPNFAFTEASGRVRSLYDIHSDYVLLMFSNPGCTNCAEVMDELTTNVFLKDILEHGFSLKVANIYIDQEIDKWKEYVHNYPSSWICGYDHNYVIRTDIMYNVRAIPSLYLLSKDKTVIMKDATTERIIKYLVAKHNNLNIRSNYEN